MYRDKLCDAKDLETFDKTQKDIMKKNFDDATESDVFIDPLIYCHFAKYACFCSIVLAVDNTFHRGIGEPKYMPVKEWESLHKILTESLRVTNMFQNISLGIQ